MDRPLTLDDVVLQIPQHLTIRNNLDEVGVVILAGGQSSRLGMNKASVNIRSWEKYIPKPIGYTGVFNPTLLQILIEKVYMCHVAIMTNKDNEEEIRKQLDGLYIETFRQDETPFQDDEGSFYHKDGKIILAPDGNGKVFHYMKQAGILDRWIFNGIRYLCIIPIDNPAIYPFDLLYYLQTTGGDLAVKSIIRDDPNEKVGILKTDEDDRLYVDEYIDEENKYGNIAYTGMFSCTTDFALKASNMNLPYHQVLKKIPGSNVLAYKNETFIFDTFKEAETWLVINVDRKQFNPIKVPRDLL